MAHHETVHPVLHALGFPAAHKVAIFHADDVGMCHGSNLAFGELSRTGAITCGAVMVPCPWFSEVAGMAGATPDLDLGVHLTLTSEWRAYRWAPISTASRSSGLIDEHGYLWRRLPLLAAHLVPEAAEAEMRAQIERALRAGIDVTHLDTHMGAVMLPQYLPAYIGLAIEFRVPVFFPRLNERRLAAQGDGQQVYAEQHDRLEALGWPLLDTIIHRTLSEIEPAEKDRRFREMFASLRPGLTHFLVHPCKDGGELAAMSPTDARHRAAEYEIFRLPDLRNYCEGLGIKLTGYREIRDRLRASLPARV